MNTINQGHIYSDGIEKYIACHVSENRYALINLTTGNRYSEPVSDINKIFAGDDFRLVEDVSDLTKLITQ